MWNDTADDSIKISNMKAYAQGLYNCTVMAFEGEGLFYKEKKVYGDFAALLYPLVLALERYDEEEFPMTEETGNEQHNQTA